MKSPKWQRARIITAPAVPETIGHEIWLKLGPPTLIDADSIHDGGYLEPELRYDAAISSPSAPLGCVLSAIDVELLARDENDFAEDVRLVPWEEFLANCRAAKGVKDDAN